MKRWTILTSVIIVGAAIAVGVWLFVRATTDTPPDTTGDAAPRGFFSFFGTSFGIDGETASTTAPSTTETPSGPSFRERLRRAQMLPLSDSMIAGATFVTTNAASSTATTTTDESVRFVERETGHINEISLETGLERRVTNTTIPAIQEALWGENGSFVALRYLGDDNETIETYIAPLTASSSEPYDLTGVFLPQNIASMALAPVGDGIFFTTTTWGGALGRIATTINSDQRTVFSSPLRDWISSWEAPDEIFVTSKPSLSATGISYAVKKDGGATRILSGTGLMVLPSPSGKRVLYSTVSAGTLRSFVLTRAPQETLALSVRTLPEKCVWRNDDALVCAVPDIVGNDIPDAWYQGRTSFNDSIWTIDIPNERYDFLYAPQDTDANETMDITSLALSSDGTLLSLINKKDLRGWIADLNAVNDEQ